MLTGLGDANDIAPFVEGRNSVALNGRWPCVRAEYEVCPQSWVNPTIIELDGQVSSHLETRNSRGLPLQWAGA